MKSSVAGGELAGLAHAGERVRAVDLDPAVARSLAGGETSHRIMHDVLLHSRRASRSRFRRISDDRSRLSAILDAAKPDPRRAGDCAGGGFAYEGAVEPSRAER